MAFFSEWVAKLSRQAALLNRYKVQEMKQVSWVCDNSKAKAELGFSPKIEFSKGIKETAEWYQQHGWI